MTTVIGIVFGAILTVVSILLEGQLMSFWSASSVLIVFGGVAASVMASYNMEQLKSFFKAFGMAFKNDNTDIEGSINAIIEMANIARKEGLLALENATADIENPLMKKGIMLIVDGTDPELVQNILETEMSYAADRHGTITSMFDNAGAFAPGYGMIGTLIGLINMLMFLDDPDVLGPSMGVALITTFYGSLLSNLVFTPISTKLKIYSSKEELESEIILEGILSIQNGENPRIIKEKLLAFVSQAEAAQLSDESNTEKGGDA